MSETETIAVAAYKKGFNDGFIVGGYAASIFIVGVILISVKIQDRRRKKNP